MLTVVLRTVKDEWFRAVDLDAEELGLEKNGYLLISESRIETGAYIDGIYRSGEET